MARTALTITTLIALTATLFIATEQSHAQSTDTFDASLESRSAIGFYGVDAAGGPLPDRAGIMLVFDSPVVELSSNGTFWVKADDGSDFDVVDLAVHENLVFLKLANQIAYKTTLTIGMNEGEYIVFNDGDSRVSFWFGAWLEIDDDIPPTLDISLSGGSGTGIGDEGPDRLTRDKIDITVTSYEPLPEPPKVTVVCNDIAWKETVGGETVERGIDDFVAHLSDQLIETQSADADAPNYQTPDYRCGSDDITLTTDVMIAMGATSWTYRWANPEDAPAKLKDGLLTVVVHARDQPQHPNYDRAQVGKWNTATANFVLDTMLNSPLEPGGGSVYPANGSKTLRNRPYVSVGFAEPTAVTLRSFRVDGVNRLDEIQTDSWSSNGFVFWPPNLPLGTHIVQVSASDAAGNTVTFETRFESDLRPPFILRLQPGWNAISFPARPVDNEIESIFTDPSIRFVVKWRPFSGDSEYGPWLWSSRRQGKLKVHIPDDHPIFESRVDFRYGLWVYSEDAVSQPVRLYPNYGYCSGSALPRDWAFRGVIDWDDDQIEDHFGEDLRDEGETVTAHRYLWTDALAYRWDAENQRYIALQSDDPVKIGEAIWVYYGERERAGSSASCP